MSLHAQSIVEPAWQCFFTQRSEDPPGIEVPAITEGNESGGQEVGPGEWTSYQKEGPFWAQSAQVTAIVPWPRPHELMSRVRRLLQKQESWKDHFLVAFGGLREYKEKEMATHSSILA